MTNTCCLDCSTQTCIIENCRDTASMGKWCGKKQNKPVDFKDIKQAECVAECPDFHKKEEEKK